MKLLNCEFLKTRKRYVLITTVLITLFELCWIFYGKYSDDNIRKGWMLLLYQLPLINAIFMPLLSIIVASRLSDIEHKGYMLKQLCCITPKGRLYDAKLVYGLGMVLASLVLQFAGVYIGGKYLGFGVRFLWICMYYTGFLPSVRPLQFIFSSTRCHCFLKTRRFHFLSE